MTSQNPTFGADIVSDLFAMRDETYKEFHRKLIPTVNPKVIIGVRTPLLRAYAKRIAKTPAAAEFLSSPAHTYYEENNLHAFLVEAIKDYDTAVAETERFLPYIDNWATCDMFMPKVFAKNRDKIILKAREFIKTDSTYTIRFGISILMRLFLDDAFKSEYLELAAAVHSDEYYVNTMLAWYFATALAKQYDAAIVYFVQQRLDERVHNKAIQKAVESRRIEESVKCYLKSLKIKF